MPKPLCSHSMCVCVCGEEPMGISGSWCQHPILMRAHTPTKVRDVQSYGMTHALEWCLHL